MLLKPIRARTLVCAGGKGDMVRPLREMAKVLKEGNSASRAGVARGVILHEVSKPPPESPSAQSMSSRDDPSPSGSTSLSSLSSSSSRPLPDIQ